MKDLAILHSLSREQFEINLEITGLPLDVVYQHFLPYATFTSNNHKTQVATTVATSAVNSCECFTENNKTIRKTFCCCKPSKTQQQQKIFSLIKTLLVLVKKA